MAISLIFLFLGCQVSYGSDESLDQKILGVNKALMCPVCPGETIDQSQSELAKQMRAVVKEKLILGESKEEILGFFVERYGENVLAAPPKEGFNLLIWIAPLIGILAGLSMVIIILKNLKGKRTVVDMEQESTTELHKYWENVERDVKNILGDNDV